jgi:hypothetical protein
MSDVPTWVWCPNCAFIVLAAISPESPEGKVTVVFPTHFAAVGIACQTSGVTWLGPRTEVAFAEAKS